MREDASRLKVGLGVQYTHIAPGGRGCGHSCICIYRKGRSSGEIYYPACIIKRAAHYHATPKYEVQADFGRDVSGILPARASNIDKRTARYQGTGPYSVPPSACLW